MDRYNTVTESHLTGAIKEIEGKLGAKVGAHKKALAAGEPQVPDFYGTP